ncbi:galactoside 2-alpha-L-fucosyltransferase-like [Phragmites australis]|uniref:galactoside 2-alpha-L-fucosyltransferase-like n=1 Tax=Phragmites australis TaxID=29695 RepID=UPI002D77D860|nr:galactoside 2-alpha-L-fucosyltransferase-like [Phragmites australis]
MEMSGAGGVPKLDDPAEEPWPAATACMTRREKERWRRVLIIVCLVLLVFFLLRLESPSMVWQSARAKLTAMHGGGFMNASHAGATKADELLGGLLAPGFSRRSCLSRYQSHQYYKHFPYAPSSYLLHKLRSYEARHKKCAPGTPLYAKSVEQLRSGRSAEAMECNYLVWLPFDGLGNRMLSMVSGFLYALLTDRVLLVALPQDSSDLFCEPFPDTTWLLPPDFPVANLFGLGPQPDQSYTSLLDKKKMVNDPANATALSVPPYVYLSLGYQLVDKLFFCGEDQLVLAKVNWLLLYSDLYFVPSLYSIAEFQNELRRLFPAKESVAHLLARYLLHPTNSVWGLVTRYYHSYLDQAKQRIGIQIRMFNFASIPADDMYNQILACSRQEHILPETDGDEAAAATGNLSATNNGGDEAEDGYTAILIASLYADYYERMRSAYYEHAARGGARVGVFQPTHEERQATEKLAHNQKALAEIYLLSFSEVLLTSGMSTFGYVSSSLAGLRPTILLPAHGHRVPETPCLQAVSMEPCNLTPAREECRGKAVDKEDLARHIKVCEDFQGGVKFFD